MNIPKVALVHQINPANAQHASLALAEANLLSEIINTIIYNQNDYLKKTLSLLPNNIKNQIFNELSRRVWLDSDYLSIKIYPWEEIIRIFLSRTRLAPFFGLTYKQLVEWVYVSLDQKVAKNHLKNIDAIYSYEDLAATTFEEAKKLGVICLYDLPIPYYKQTRKIMLQEAERYPELASSIDSAKEPDWKLARKQREIELADHIFVASSFTEKSLQNTGIKSDKITVIPYGAPTDYFQPQAKLDNIFRAIYIGRVSPRKGVHYLIQAWQELNLKEAELMLVGGNLFSKNWFTKYQDIFKYIPSVPHLLLNQYYSQGSVFVFPSLVEGFGLVILEAMACGIPVITTPNTGGADIITDGVEGFIIPIRDVEALKEKLAWCHSHPKQLAEMGVAARYKAEQLTWKIYREKLANKVQEVIKQTKDYEKKI
jgi:glycosyltransferase involved in cell wall biosynthesis